MPKITTTAARRRTTHRLLRYVTLCGIVLLIAVSDAAPALAADGATLGGVIDKLRGVVLGLLVGLATLFLTLGAVRYLAADGDPGEVERAKKSLRNALIGYGVAMLAPAILALLQTVVG